jgi:hypothetical protein
MNCAEANAAADLYRALGLDAEAGAIIAAHVEHDDEEERATHSEGWTDEPIMVPAPPATGLAPGEDPADNLTETERADYLRWRAEKGLGG